MVSTAIRVLLVDDHALVRTGIRKILDAVPDIEVVGEAASGEEGAEAARKLNPDIVLMDKHMPGIGGVEATRRVLTLRGPKVICLTVDMVGPLPRRMLEMGAMGFLTKSCAPEEMIEAVRKVHAGERVLGQKIAQRLAEQALDDSGDTPFDSLSARELQVAIMLAGGHSSQQISTLLSLSPKTVSTYRARIFQKADCETVVDLVRKAIQFGLIESDTKLQEP
ncbi:MAG: response regulator [Rhizobiales bacterium]|nr:response regulator [Hyphomicrobiales bacterium]